MPPKKFKLGAEKGFIGDTNYKSTPKPYIEPEALKTYRLHRDVCYYIQTGIGEFDEGLVEEVRGIYFKTLF